ncbi:MAG TPA: amidohydrolase family protein [bacterium]|uniref:Glucuronate isomerase n=1 Tax=candidate division TA06 bacterium ADurb.Bin417 TaxID=1852828 RepID=A0A1V5MKF7_UNCT6|nr:MAG: glucuronate isomerase [candidate division TA06 bacterium ADurb.Bin417]HNQ34995.1 amidohydrolase family protein [bacterium]HNS49250.1 amidohydrolase family protein [bacterium]
MEKREALKRELLTQLYSLRTVDGHSHTYAPDVYYAREINLFNLQHYFQRDAAGLIGPWEMDAIEDPGECWRRLKTALESAGNTAYWRHQLLVYRKLFDFTDPELDDANWRRLDTDIRRKTSDPNWYDYVTRSVCNLEIQVRNVGWGEAWDRRYFAGVLRMENALRLDSAEGRTALEKRLDRPIDSLKAARAGLADLASAARSDGAVGLKLAHAYFRTLDSRPVTETRATRLFEKSLGPGPLDPAEARELQDHFIFYLAELCAELSLVFQIHTGVQTTWGAIPESDPLLLLPLLNRFRAVRFDLFHAGYPYARMLGMLGKHYPNAWLNLAWIYLVSPAASRQVLSEWLDLVPIHRLIGFGSDVHFPELIWGHLEMARDCVAEVLTDKVTQDYWSEGLARDAARKLFRENGLELYALKK